MSLTLLLALPDQLTLPLTTPSTCGYTPSGPGTSTTTDTSTDINVHHTAPKTSRITDFSTARMGFVTSTGDSEGDGNVVGSTTDDTEETVIADTRTLQASHRREDGSGK